MLYSVKRCLAQKRICTRCLIFNSIVLATLVLFAAIFATKQPLTSPAGNEKGNRSNNTSQKADNQKPSQAFLSMDPIVIGTLIIAASNFLMAIGILWQLKLIRSSNRNAQDTARRQLRSYVGVLGAEMIALEPDEDFDLHAQILLKNFGQTPAYDVVVRVRPITVGKLRLHNFDRDLSNTDGPDPMIVWPGNVFSRRIRSVLTPQEKHDLLEGHCDTVIVGDVRYTDAFDIARKTEFIMIVQYFGTKDARIVPFGAGDRAT